MNNEFDYDFSALLGTPVRVSPPSPMPNEPQQQKKRIHFESSRAGGTFAIDNHLHWSKRDNEQFYQWKQHPTTSPQTTRMAHEIAKALLSLFGGTMPAMRFTSPPRGKTPADQPHAAQELSRATATTLERSYEVCVLRATADTQSGRSRMQNLSDDSVFCLAPSVQDDLLTVVIDDVSTTGSTLKRMRQALADIPTLCFVYVIWH